MTAGDGFERVGPDVSDTFHRPCLTCGAAVDVVQGREVPHDCHPADTAAGLIAHAYWSGHDRRARGEQPETGHAAMPELELPDLCEWHAWSAYYLIGGFLAERGVLLGPELKRLVATLDRWSSECHGAGTQTCHVGRHTR